MRGTASKRLRRSAKKLSKGENEWKKTYKHLKTQYKKTGSIDVIGNNERASRAERRSKAAEIVGAALEKAEIARS